MATTVQNEKWILTAKELHFGHCKETFRAGAVIELDEANGRLIIDGRRFNDTRDLDVLKRQSNANLDNPWVVPYSKEAHAEIVASFRPPVVSQRKALHPDQALQVIKSDEDLNDPIDIGDTQVSKVNARAKEAARQKVKTGALEIVRGDETIEERLASLKNKTDIGSIAERARLKSSGSVKMEVVHDDSLGAGFTGKNAVSLNAGQHIPSREEADAKAGTAQVQAEARKRDAEIKRQAQAETVVEAPVSDPVAEDPKPVPVEGLQAENAQLKADNAAMVARMDRLEKMLIAQQGAAPKRGPGRPPKSAAPAVQAQEA